MALLAFGLLLLLFGIGMPVAFALLGVGIALFGWQGLDLVVIPQRMVPSCNQFTYLAVPFFFLAAEIMNLGAITDRIYRFAQSVVGHVRGGLAHVNILANMIFAGMSGSALADAAGLGKVGIPAMTRAGYSKEYSTAVLIAASTVGPIIPPSIPMVVIGSIADISVGRLFFGGAVPGLLMGAAMMVLCYWQAVRHGYGSAGGFSWGRVWHDYRRAALALFTPVIILGGFLLGVFTPTEAAAVASVYAFILAGLVYRGLGLRRVFKSFIEVGVSTSATMIIIGAASIFGLIMSRENVADGISAALLSLTTSPTLLLLLFVALWVFVGCFMEAGAAMVLIVPLLMPVVHAVKIDPVHFGVITVVTLMLGLLTPPFGILLFLSSSMTGLPVHVIARATFPFMLAIGAVILLLVLVPSLVLTVPNLVFGVQR